MNKVLHVECGGGGQNVHYQEILQLSSSHVPAKPVSLTLIIHVDSYPAQAWAEIRVWANDRWEKVFRLTGHGMKTPLNLGYRAGINFSDVTHLGPYIKDDRKTLLDMARNILQLRPLTNV
jgi:hypothetical protein